MKNLKKKKKTRKAHIVGTRGRVRFYTACTGPLHDDLVKCRKGLNVADPKKKKEKTQNDAPAAGIVRRR